LSIHKTRAVI